MSNHQDQLISAQFRHRCEMLVDELGICKPADIQSIRMLTGGVSSDIGVISFDDRKICVKCSLKQLRVDEPWFAPLRRNLAEYRWIEFASQVCPTSVPRLLGRSDRANGFAMRFIEPTQAWNYKSGLLQGRADEGEAAAVGNLIGRIHAASVSAEFDPGRFANATDFHALRLEPYLIFTAKRHPSLSVQLNRLAHQFDNARIALVHGDLSPKNVLIGTDGPILLDAECASFGDPAFDVAFFATHLVLKSIHLPDSADNLMHALQQFYSAYLKQVNWESADQTEQRACGLLPGLLLARVDGKSPAEYLNEASRSRIRHMALELLNSPETSSKRLLERIANPLERGKS